MVIWEAYIVAEKDHLTNTIGESLLRHPPVPSAIADGYPYLASFLFKADAGGSRLILTAWPARTSTPSKDDYSPNYLPIGFVTLDYAEPRGLRWRVVLDCTFDETQPLFQSLIAKLESTYRPERKPKSGGPKRGMTEERRKRAELFKSIKDKAPALSRVAVANKARLQPGYEDVTEEDVRNDYREMGWKWERADRVR